MYSTSFKALSLATVIFSEGGNEVHSFVPVPGDALQGMMEGEEAVSSTNLTKFAPFGISVQGGATIKALSRDGVLVDATDVGSKDVLMVDGQISSTAAALASSAFTLLGQDADVDEAKVKKNLKSFTASDIKAAEIKIFREENNAWVEMAWSKVLLHYQLPKIRVEVTLSDDKETNSRADSGLPVLLLAGDRNDAFPKDAFTPKFRGRSRSEKLALSGGKFSVEISPENLKKDLMGPAGRDNVNEVCAADFIGDPKVSNEKDTENFPNEFKSRNYRIRGYAVHRGAPLIRQDSKQERLGIGDVNKEFIQAAGVELLIALSGVQSDKEMPKTLPPVFGVLARQMQNSADFFMYSGHGMHQTGGIAAAEDPEFVSPTGHQAPNQTKPVINADLAHHWTNEIREDVPKLVSSDGEPCAHS